MKHSLISQHADEINELAETHLEALLALYVDGLRQGHRHALLLASGCLAGTALGCLTLTGIAYAKNITNNRKD